MPPCNLLFAFPFLFDGFDEISGDLTQRAINERAASKIFTLPSILSCRKNFYEFYLSISFLQELYPQRIELQPLRLTHPVTQYITAFCQKKQVGTPKKVILLPERIVAAIQQNQALRDLVQHPLSLVMVLDIVTDLQEIDQHDWSKAKLYQKYTEKWLKHEAAKPDSVLRWHEKSVLIQEIAWWLYTAKGPTTSTTALHETVTFTQQELSSRLKDLTAQAQPIPFSQLVDDICFRTFLLANDGDTYYFIHKSFQEYYVARYIFERLRSREQKIEVLAQVLQEFLPVEIFGFLKAMLHAKRPSGRDRDLVTDNLIRTYQQNSLHDHRSATIRQNASHYLAFLGTQQAIQFLEQAYEAEPDKWVRRGMMVGLAFFCGRGDILNRYIESIHSDPEAASINIGYHLVYYGDQPPEERYYDRGGEKCDKTVQAIFHHLSNEDYQYEWALDLLTLRMLLERRGLAIFSADQRYLPFLKQFLGQHEQEQGELFQREKTLLQETLERMECL